MATVQDTYARCLEYFVNTDPNKIPWPEVLFYIINILYVFVAAYYILVAYIEVAWQSGMNGLQQGFSMTGDDIYIYETSVLHHMIAIFLIVLILIGIYAAYTGEENMLYGYCILMLLTIIVELYVAFKITVRSQSCASLILNVRMILKHHVRNIYQDEQYMGFMDKSHDPFRGFEEAPLKRRKYSSYILMDSIQRSLGCCGYDNYFDYLDPSKGAPILRDPISNDESKSRYMVPFSCCTPKYAFNIHCSSKLWNDSVDLLKSQLHVSGCTNRIVELCDEIIKSTSRGAFFVCFIHIIIYLLSIPLIVIQIRIFHVLASDTPYNFSEKKFDMMMLDHVHPLHLQDYEKIEHRYETSFHRDSDFVLTDEMKEFVNDMKRQHGVAAEDDICHNVLVASREGPKVDSVWVEDDPLAVFTMTREDKRRFQQHEGRFNYFLNKELLNYAAAVLNSDPSNADSSELDQSMKQAEMVARMTAYYKHYTEAAKDKYKLTTILK